MATDSYIGKVFGKCRLEKKIGKGAIGIVYKAYHLTLNIDVAVKLLNPQTSLFSDSATQRFQREAKAAGFLEHRNILKIYDIGEQEDFHYIVMEYIDGKSVEEYLVKQGPLPVKKSIRIIKQVAEALSAAHAASILHRDVKPANILIQKKDELAKLADFGLARLNSQKNVKLTDTGAIIGTMAYTAPDQMKGQPSASSDLYSLGATFFEMLTGRLPYEGESAYAIMNQHVSAPVPSVRRIRKDVPSKIDDLIKRLMAKDPAQRPPSAVYVAEFLDGILKKVKKMGEGEDETPHIVPKKSKTRERLVTKQFRMPPKGGAYETKYRSSADSKKQLKISVDELAPANKTSVRNFRESTGTGTDTDMLLASTSGTFEYRTNSIKSVDRLWLMIITIFFVLIALITSGLAVKIFLNK